MPRVVIAVVTLIGSCLLAVAPSGAHADEPIVRTDGESITYVDPALEDERTVAVEGTLLQVVVEPGSDHAHDGGGMEQVLVTDDGTNVPVVLDLGDGREPTEVPVEADLVAGPELERALEGEAVEPVEVAAATIATESSTTAAPVTAHRAYVAVVTNSGATTLPTRAVVDARVDEALSWWVTESSGAISSFTRPVAQVRYASTRSDRCGLQGGFATSNLWNEAAARFPGVNFSNPGNHLVVVVDDECPGTGIATVGAGLSSGGLTTLREDARIFTSTLVHEIGHNVGLLHANFNVAGSAAASSEYWNLYSPMALAVSSAAIYGPPALDSIYRAQLQVLSPGEVEQVSTGTSRTVSLAARGAPSGTRAIRVVADGRTYWIDLRDGSARDAASFYGRAPTSSIGGRRYPHAVTVTVVEPSAPGGTRLLAPTSTVGGWVTGQTVTLGSLTVRVDAISGGTATVTVSNGATAPTGPPPPPIVAGQPAVVGTPKVGVRLTAAAGTWTPGATLSYQWLANGAQVSGARASTFTPGAAHRGRRISVQVTGRRDGYVTTSRTSVTTAPVAAGTLRGATPRIIGTPRVGRTLRAAPGTWTGATTRRYRWFVNGRVINGATNPTYVPTRWTRGKRITVKVTGTRPGYTSLTRTSAPTAFVR